MSGVGIKNKAGAWLAAMAKGTPGRRMKVIVVVGSDGADTTIAFLAEILRRAGHRVGVVARDFVQIGEERVSGSDMANPMQDATKLQDLLAQIKRAGCKFAILELPHQLPSHGFVGLPIEMLVVRRAGDAHLSEQAEAIHLNQIKAMLGRQPKLLVLPRDDPAFERMGLQEKANSMTYGTHHKSECRIVEVQLHPKGSAANLLVDHQTKIKIITGLAGQQAIYSAAASCAAAYLLGIAVDRIESGVTSTSVQSGRMEYLPVVRPYQVVLDKSYTPDGISEVLGALKHFTKNRLIVVTGATLEQPIDQLPIISEIICRAADRIVLGDSELEVSGADPHRTIMSSIVACGGEAKTDELPDRNAAIAKALGIARRGDIIVICPSGARPYRQMGEVRQSWSDRQVIKDLLGGDK